MTARADAPVRQPLRGQIALVTGASRGVGKGVAVALGRAGATVYATGRTVEEGAGAVPLAGSVSITAAAVDEAGGRGVGVVIDQRDDSQIERLVERIMQAHDRLDILVNSAWRGYEGYVTGEHLPPATPFWVKPLGYWDANVDGVRWMYVATRAVAPHLAERTQGLVVNISFDPQLGDPAYGAAKAATDRLTAEFAEALRRYGVTVAGLYPGLVRTENVLANARWFDMSTSQSPELTGKAVVALALDPQRLARSGGSYHVAELAAHYGFEDEPNP